MAWNDPPDWVALETVTAAQMNQSLRDNKRRTWKIGPIQWTWPRYEDGILYLEVPRGLL